jgi:hypothetical protein
MVLIRNILVRFGTWRIKYSKYQLEVNGTSSVPAGGTTIRSNNIIVRSARLSKLIHQRATTSS